MNKFLTELLIASICGTALGLVLIALAPLTKKRFSQKWHYYINLLPIIFLLGGTKILALLFARLNPTHSFQGGYSITAINIEQNIAVDYISRIVPYIVAAWLIGFLCCLISVLVNSFRFQRGVMRCSIAFGRAGAVKILKSPCINAPMYFGIIKPTIVLPSIEFGEKELELILAHELVHYRRGDILVKFVVLLATAAHWFNPFVHRLNRRISRYCETSCDELLATDMDAEERILYADTIISTLEQGIVNNYCIYAGLGSTKKLIKERIELIMENKQRKFKLPFVVVALVLICLGGLVANGISQSSFVTKLADSDEVNQAEGVDVIYGESVENATNTDDAIVAKITVEEVHSTKVGTLVSVGPVYMEGQGFLDSASLEELGFTEENYDIVIRDDYVVLYPKDGLGQIWYCYTGKTNTFSWE